MWGRSPGRSLRMPSGISGETGSKVITAENPEEEDILNAGEESGSFAQLRCLGALIPSQG